MDTIDDMLSKDTSHISDFTNEVLQLTCTQNNQIRAVVSIIEENEKAIVFSPKELQNSLIIDNESNPLSVCYLVNGKIKRNNENKVVAYIVEELVEIIQ
ncbi:MAG: hypothetical protein ACI9CD_000047 [Candidatus Deianiraeaceae bacterium]|jgi:hypothetical protein